MAEGELPFDGAGLYKRFTFNYRHSVFYCISKYYLRGTSYLCDPSPEQGHAA